MSSNILEKLSESHYKKQHILQMVKRLLAQEECSQNEVEEIIESLAYEYIENL